MESTSSSTHTETTTVPVTQDYVLPPAAHAAALWSGLGLVTLLILAGYVISRRQKHKVLLGDGEVPEMTRATRVFGNATEYLPAGMAALVAMAVVGVGAWVVHLVGALLIAGRVAHAYGLSRSEGASPGRMAGIGLTFVAFLLAALALIFHGLF